ncbi:MAG: SMI1/KNR4 family protein [Chloroflexota bacterium]
MNELLMADAEIAPFLFLWHGPVDPLALDEWIARLGIVVPDELRDLWIRTGGGEMFEGEDILRPILTANMDHTVDGVERANEWYRTQGLSSEHLLFETGAFVAAVRQRDGAIVDLDSNTFEEREAFATLSEWYLKTERDEFAQRYGLPSAGES